MGTGSAPTELVVWIGEMLAAAIAAPRIRVPTKKRSDFFMIFPFHKQVTS